MNNLLKEKLRSIRHIALDMDGTIYLGDNIFPYTIPFLEKLDRLGIEHSFLTNNPTKSRTDYIRKLAGMGIIASDDQMFTTSLVMRDYIKSHYPRARRLFMLGTPSMKSQFLEAGFEESADDPDDVPDIVVVSFDMTLEYDRFCRAAWWVEQGIPYLATNPDKVCPTDRRTVLIDCGSICKAIEWATGRAPDITLGKPAPDMLLEILSGRGVAPSEAAMVGDRIYTDIAMAQNAGALGVLVLSGETTVEAAKSAPNPPDIIVKDIEEFGNLLEEARK